MQKVERHLTSVHTTSFFFPTSKIETILEFGINGDCLFYLAYDYGNNEKADRYSHTDSCTVLFFFKQK